MRITRSMQTLMNFRRRNCASLNHGMPESSGSLAQIKVYLNHLPLMMYNGSVSPKEFISELLCYQHLIIRLSFVSFLRVYVCVCVFH